MCLWMLFAAFSPLLLRVSICAALGSLLGSREVASQKKIPFFGWRVGIFQLDLVGAMGNPAGPTHIQGKDIRSDQVLNGDKLGKSLTRQHIDYYLLLLTTKNHFKLDLFLRSHAQFSSKWYSKDFLSLVYIIHINS